MTTPRTFQLLDALERELPDAPELAALRSRITAEHHERMQRLHAEREELEAPRARRRRPMTPERIAEAKSLLQELGHADLVARALGISRAQTYRLLNAPEASS